MNIKKIKRPKNITNFNLSPNEKSEISNEDTDFNLIIFNQNEQDVIERSLLNIFHQIKNDSKKILLLINESKINKELMGKIFELINQEKRENKVDIILNMNVKDIKENNYNVIIELPFSNLNESNANKKYFSPDFNFGYKNQYFSFVNSNQIFELFRIKLENINKISVVNAATHFYSNLFLNSNKSYLYDKINEYFNNFNVNKEHPKEKNQISPIKNKKEELTNRYGKQYVEEIVELIKNNQDLKEQLFYKFIKDKHMYLFNNPNMNVSLINGKKGYYTVRMIPPMKQREDRYFIYKFLLKEKLLEDESITSNLLRVYENFEHVTHFHENIINTAFKKCKDYGIDCEIIKELPYIYESPLINIYKNQ